MKNKPLPSITSIDRRKKNFVFIQTREDFSFSLKCQRVTNDLEEMENELDDRMKILSTGDNYPLVRLGTVDLDGSIIMPYEIVGFEQKTRASTFLFR